MRKLRLCNKLAEATTNVLFNFCVLVELCMIWAIALVQSGHLKALKHRFSEFLIK